MPNRLADQKSLYLRQHADNPVDWYPWGKEALERAKAEDKPLLVSVGYSACHWCHVMAHESFEDEYIAKLMNEHFVCIKVDREERPDIDRIYMESIQMIMGHGGWPLNAFCLPDGRCFAGGTYFPPDDSTGRGGIPWPQLLMRVSDYYQRRRDELAENADNIIKNLQASNNPLAPTKVGQPMMNLALVNGAKMIAEQHDDQYGGFGDAPKFPPSMALNYLGAVRGTMAVEMREPEFAQRLDQVVTTTLRAMAHGGIFDQVGGGFARYSVDKIWLIPHFEKMLYDNGLLLDTYTKGWLRHRLPLFRDIVAETIDWLEREMRAPNGGFYSALDADTDGEEGKTYVWTPKEVKEVLGEEEGAAFCDAFNITEEGNFEGKASNPALGAAEHDLRDKLKDARAKLLAHRYQRPQPGKDTKQLVSWNSLVIRGMAEAGFAFGETRWLESARAAADWIWDTMRGEGDRLKSVYYDGDIRENGYLDDYAYYAEALLSLAGKVDWIDPGASATYIKRARGIVASVIEHFSDPEGQPGYYFVSADHEELPHRRKEWFDNATPSGNSCMVQCLSALHALTGEGTYREQLELLRTGYPGLAEKAAYGVAHALEGFTSDALGIAVVKAKDVEVEPLRAVLSARPWRKVFILKTDDAAQPEGYQLCVGTECMEPTRDPEEIAKLL